MPVFLPTDGVMLLLILMLGLYIRLVFRRPSLLARWRRVFARPSASAAAVMLSAFLVIAAIDSVHYRPALPPGPGGETAYAPFTVSLLDTIVKERLGAAGTERSYSAPFAAREWDKTTVLTPEGPVRDFQPLRHAAGGSGETDPGAVILLSLIAAGTAFSGLLAAGAGFVLLSAQDEGVRPSVKIRELFSDKARLAALVTAGLIWVFAVWAAVLWPDRHIFGTDAAGSDVLLEALKSIRTAVVIGTLATLATLPFAVTLGIAAGYFRGRTDDVIQYVYTTLSSIPGVLLIAASVLMVTVFMDQHPDWWPTGLERADARLFLLALIIGLTGWATLARLLRAETMKIASLEYVTAARAMGVSHARIMFRHVLPNVLHIILIVTVLDFSGIVLYEAVLSYVGVGVDPTMSSFGTMINAARSEMSRTPMIWWNLLASFLFMLTLVLSANLFAAAVRDAFDPRAADLEN
ncbi:MAG: ABC transporter permease [Sutterella sp.]|nr:ABC transporter permease [Sutterella sp.]